MFDGSALDIVRLKCKSGLEKLNEWGLVMIIQSDSLLTLILTFLSLTVLIEYLYSIWIENRDVDEDKSTSVPGRNFFRPSFPAVIMSPPVHQGSLRRDRYMEDFLVGGRFVPNHYRRLRLNRCQKHNSDAARINESQILVSMTDRKSVV